MNSIDESEEIYFEVIDIIAENGDYFQPEDIRWSLPETIIAALASAIFISFFQGFFKKSGEDLYLHVKSKVIKDKKFDVIETQEIIDRLSKLEINNQNDFDEGMLNAANSVYDKFISLGLSQSRSEKLTEEVIDIIKRNKNV